MNSVLSFFCRIFFIFLSFGLLLASDVQAHPVLEDTIRAGKSPTDHSEYKVTVQGLTVMGASFLIGQGGRQILSIWNDGLVRIDNVGEYKPLLLDEVGGGVSSVSFSDFKNYALVSLADNSIILLSVIHDEEGNPKVVKSKLQEFGRKSVSLHLGMKGSLAVSGFEDGSYKVWRIYSDDVSGSNKVDEVYESSEGICKPGSMVVGMANNKASCIQDESVVRFEFERSGQGWNDQLPALKSLFENSPFRQINNLYSIGRSGLSLMTELVGQNYFLNVYSGEGRFLMSKLFSELTIFYSGSRMFYFLKEGSRENYRYYVVRIKFKGGDGGVKNFSEGQVLVGSLRDIQDAEFYPYSKANVVALVAQDGVEFWKFNTKVSSMIDYVNTPGIRKVGFSKPLNPDVEKIKVFLMRDDTVFVRDLNVTTRSIISSQRNLLYEAIKIMNKMVGNYALIQRALENGVNQ